MIGVMFSSAYSAETPERIKEQLAKKECQSKTQWHVWKDGECKISKVPRMPQSWDLLDKQKIPSDYTFDFERSDYNLNNMPKAETPKAIEDRVKGLELEGAEERIREAYERELRTMPLTQNEYVVLSAAITNKLNEIDSQCQAKYGTPNPYQENFGFSSFDQQFAYNECIISAQSWHEDQQNYILYELCCIHESQKKELMDELNRKTNLAYAELEAEKAAYLREQEGLEPVSQKPQPSGGGCLIATASFGSELAPQVQFLREIRDNTVMNTQSGTTFMTGFNQFYYSFSPAVADLERENPVFKEMVKVSLTPLLTSLTLLNYVEIDSEEEMLGYGIGIILLNIGMYFLAPAAIILQIKKWKSKN